MNKYIIFSTTEELNKKQTKEFFELIKENLGEKNLSKYNGYKILHFKEDGVCFYVIEVKKSFSNDLLSKMAELLLVKFPDIYNTFEVSLDKNNCECSDCQVCKDSKDSNVDEVIDNFMEDAESQSILSEELGKYIHKKWLKNRTENGWRYGCTLNEQQKLHPLIVEWENLPEQYKEKAEDFPYHMKDILEKNGYTIVKNNK